MMRLLTMAAGLVTIAAAAGLYVLKLDTRRIEETAHRLERDVDKTELDIAVLKSERAWLGRPERIDALARAQGLGPVRPEQYRRLEQIGAAPASGGRP